MPWKEVRVVEQRLRWISEWQQGDASVAELSRKYRVSRKTAYKWLARYQQEGAEGLLDRSSAPVERPTKIAADVEQRVVEARHLHPNWGPKKLIHWLARRQPEEQWPAVSTAAMILARHGLSRRGRQRQRAALPAAPLASAAAPNDVWAIDFKGWFRTGDGERCDPLTISDSFSRFLLCCCHLERTDTERTMAVMRDLFRNHGLPDRIRSDNGPPFASPGGLSRLSVWWLRLGILPERIDPGKPQQNGSHERMHRTLKQETQKTAAGSVNAQQGHFAEFVREYNFERPHEAIGFLVPGDLYVCSPRIYSDQLPEMVYPRGFEVRQADEGGKIRWKMARCKVGKVLAHQLIGVQELGEGLNYVWFGRQLLGVLDEQRSRSGAARRRDGYCRRCSRPPGSLRASQYP